MIDLLKKAYKGKKVFVTGHTGFKGSWMLTVLHYLGADVKGYALAPEDEPSLFSLTKGENLCENVFADIRDGARLRKELVAFQPDFVFHLAAQSLVRRSYRDPIGTYEVNVMGTVQLLEAVRSLEKPCQVIVITTDKVYENKEWWFPYREVDNLGGHVPYSSSKACTEIAAASYRSSFMPIEQYGQHHKSLATARAGNVIGGGDWAQDRIIPDLVRALDAGEPLKVRNPHAVRPWQHVLEPLGGYLLLGARMQEKPQDFCTAYNFGPHAEDNLTVGALINIALSIWGEGQSEESPEAGAPHEAKLLRLDISKAINELGWKPKLNSREAIRLTLDWYKGYKEDPLGITLAQVVQYFEAE